MWQATLVAASDFQAMIQDQIFGSLVQAPCVLDNELVGLNGTCNRLHFGAPASAEEGFGLAVAAEPRPSS